MFASKGRSWIYLFLAATILLVAGCAAPGPAVQPPAKQQPSPAEEATEPPVEPAAPEELPDLVVGDVFFYFIGFGPPMIGSFFENRVTHQLYEGLTAWDVAAIARGEPAKPVPGLAESWEVSDDGRVYTFKLRPGIEFSTGRPVNAEAVKRHFERVVPVLEANERVGRHPWVKLIESVEAVDDLTMRMTLSDPYSPLLANLASNPFKVVDVEEAMAHEEEGDLGYNWLTTHSAGTGPFMIEEYVPEQRLTLRRNPNYWGGPDGVQPSVERLIFTHIPENASRELQLSRGDLDVGLQMEPVSLRKLEANPDVTIETLPSLITCNFLVDLRMESLEADHPTVLQALKYATDYEGLLNVVAGGLAEVSQTLILPGMLGYEEETAQFYEHDPEKAKQLLAEAGFPDGFEATIQNRTGSCGSVVYGKATEFWQQNLAEAGIKAEIVESTSAQMWGAITAEEFRDFGISGLGAGFMDPDDMTTVHIINEGGMLGWDDVDPETFARVEELSEMGKRESDPEKRREMYAEISRLFVERAPIITFLAVKDAVVLRENVSNAFFVPGAYPIDFKYIVKE